MIKIGVTGGIGSGKSVVGEILKLHNIPLFDADVRRVVINEKKEALFENEILSILENAVYNSINGRSTVDFKKEAVKGMYKKALYNALKIEGV